MPASAQKKYSAPALFKDYNKATKDYLTKNYSAAGAWKVESKFKGPKDVLIINPTATSDGKIAADIEYSPSYCAAALKMNVTPAGLDNLKTTITYNKNGHKCEAVIHKKKGNEIDCEISHETAVVAGKRMSTNEKLNMKAIYLGLGVDVAPNCQVGVGATYDIKGKVCNWSAGCRYTRPCGLEAAVRTDKLQTYTTSASIPLTTTFNGNKLRVNLAAETICGKGRELQATIGAEATCPVLPKNTVKVRVNKKMEWAVAYIVKLADNWSMAVSMDKSLKAGVILTHS